MSRRTAPVTHAAALYPTPRWVTQLVVRQFARVLPRGRWLEPCAGEGAIIHAVDEVLQPSPADWWAVELDAHHAGVLRRTTRAHVRKGDARLLVPAFDALAGGVAAFDVAIANCPFSLADQIVKQCLDVASWVFNLQRLDWMEGRERRQFWIDNPCQVCPLPNRPKFIGRQDSGGYAWYVWHPDRKGRPNLWLPDVPVQERQR